MTGFTGLAEGESCPGLLRWKSSGHDHSWWQICPEEGQLVDLWCFSLRELCLRNKKCLVQFWFWCM